MRPTIKRARQVRPKIAIERGLKVMNPLAAQRPNLAGIRLLIVLGNLKIKMTNKTLKYYQISSYNSVLGHRAELNFETRELANQYILRELQPKDWPVSVDLNNLAITKKEKEWVTEKYNVYYKNDPKRIKKVVEEKVERDRYTETHNFEGYVNGVHKWREKANDYWKRDKVKGYYNFKVGEITSEVTNQSVIFRAPVMVQFVKAEFIVTPEVKVDGQPY